MKYKNVEINEDFIEQISDSLEDYFNTPESQERLRQFELLVTEYLEKTM